MSRLIKIASIPIIFAVFLIVYYNGVYYFSLVQNNGVFLTTNTFLFSIFAGFFIAQQRRRHSAIHSNIAHFDGVMSFIYRSFGHFGKTAQMRLGEVILKHYQGKYAPHFWDYHITNQSDTLSSIHKVIHDILGDESLKTLKTNMLNRISAGLLEAQVARKDMLILHREKIPTIQWAVIYLLFAVLLVSLHTIPSSTLVLESLLKASFATALIYIMVLMHQLNNLNLFENTIGESSDQDILNIIRKDMER